eukprot:Rmarinus@m.2523
MCVGSLPIEVLEEILCRVPNERTRLTAAIVCRALREAAITPFVCKAVSDRETHDHIQICTRCEEIRDLHGKTPIRHSPKGLPKLFELCRHAPLSCIRAMLHLGVERSDWRSVTVLHHAASVGRTDVVRFLVERDGMDPSRPDCNGWTALHHASSRGHLPTVRYLAEEVGMDVSAVDFYGRAPVHCALARSGSNGSAAVMKYFLREQKVRLTTNLMLKPHLPLGSMRVERDKLAKRKRRRAIPQAGTTFPHTFGGFASPEVREEHRNINLEL